MTVVRPKRDVDGYANDADAVEDPGECERRGSAFWASASWFAGAHARTEATEAHPADVAAARTRAPGGATCQNRFLIDRGARDPFLPTSATTTLAVRTAAAAGGAFAGLGRGRRAAEREGGDVAFAFDRARGVWTVVGKDGAVADVRAGRATAAVATGGRADAEAEAEAETTRAREARVRRYQAPYDEDARRFASTRVETTLERVVATPRASAPVVSSGGARARRPARDVDAPTTFADDPAIRWIPLALDDGSTVFVETAADVPPAEQLSAWCRGAAPWPDARALSLSRDRAGFPLGAPGPKISDERALEATRAALRAARRAALVAAVAPSAVAPSDADADVDALRRELATRVRERDAALAECARLRDELAARVGFSTVRAI